MNADDDRTLRSEIDEIVLWLIVRTSKDTIINKLSVNSWNLLNLWNCDIKFLVNLKMAPASTLDWSEPCQQWRYPKIGTSGQKFETCKSKSTVDLGNKEADTAYKKICNFLRKLRSKKREFFFFWKTYRLKKIRLFRYCNCKWKTNFWN